jgi:hypothetical protein
MASWQDMIASLLAPAAPDVPQVPFGASKTGQIMGGIGQGLGDMLGLPARSFQASQRLQQTGQLSPQGAMDSLGAAALGMTGGLVGVPRLAGETVLGTGPIPRPRIINTQAGEELAAAVNPSRLEELQARVQIAHENFTAHREGEFLDAIKELEAAQAKPGTDPSHLAELLSAVDEHAADSAANAHELRLNLQRLRDHLSRSIGEYDARLAANSAPGEGQNAILIKR